MSELIFLITTARSGSNYTCETITNLMGYENWEMIKSEVLNPTCYPEVLDTIKDNNYSAIVHQIKSKVKEGRHIFKFLDIQFNAYDLSVFKLCNSFPTAKVIVINRVNKLDQYISSLLSTMEHNFAKAAYTTKVGFGVINYYKYVSSNLDFYTKALSEIERSSASYITINFEDSLPSKDIQKISNYLKVDFSNINERYYIKQRTESISNYLTNSEVLNSVEPIKFYI